MPSSEPKTPQCQIVSPGRSIRGQIDVPSNKSISHRAAIIGSISEGRVKVSNFLCAEDCLATIEAMRMLGVEIEETGPGQFEIDGVGLYGLQEPSGIIDCGNSGTTMRLLVGLLAAQSFPSQLTGDQYLRQRPMDRVIRPLRQMGAKLHGQDGDRLAPIAIQSAKLKPITYDSPIASAQVKSAVLLAGLYCSGTTTVWEEFKSRDHTERMLHEFGADIEVSELTASISGPAVLRSKDIVVPGDVSSAAFFVAAAALLPDSELVLRNVGLNWTRATFLEAARDMGADISGMDIQDDGLTEPAGDLVVRGGRQLKAITIGADEIPRLSDEIPILAVMALKADGTTIIEGAEELRVKETDRLSAIAQNLSALGAEVEEQPDGLIIQGPQQIRGGTVESFGDHRIAMAMAIAALVAEEPVTINDAGWVDTSFPDFFEILDKVTIRS